MSKILILGCGGMLGDAVRKEFPDAIHTDAIANEKGLVKLDIRNYEDCEKYIKYSKMVINLAAMTDVDLCEKEPLSCFEINYIGAKNVADLCIACNKELVYISTAGIFSAKDKEFFTDTDKPEPVSRYAISKYLGELASLKSYVIRACWMFGGGIKKDKKFIMKIMNQIKNGATELNVVNDRRGSLTYTVDFARGIKNIIKSGKYGVYNQVCEGFTDRYEIAKEMVNLLGLDIPVNAVSSSYFEGDGLRPANECLKNSDGVYMRHWKDCLAEYIQELSKK
jgi:dTDP-4-dehydrorhamnose reductase